MQDFVDLLKSNSPVLLAIIGLASTLGMYVLGENKSIRKELRKEVKDLKQDILGLKGELIGSKKKYEKLQEDHLKLKHQYMALSIQLDDIVRKFVPPEHQGQYGWRNGETSAHSG